MSIADSVVVKEPVQRSMWRDYAPRLWMGMRFRSWMRLLRDGHFDVTWQYYHIVAALTWWSLVNSLWTRFQWLTHGWRVKNVQITEPPIFIIGHWRSGTTLLHEMLVLDPRHGYPTTYQCLAPNHFLRTEWVIGLILPLFLPSRRPMDNMPFGLNRPQEDEFALANLGLNSPYRSVAFPNHPPMDEAWLTLDVSEPERSHWKSVLLQFMREITFKQRKRLVLKSPPHTARIRTLREMFPDAKFVHIVRDPYVVFPSTVNLWKKLADKHGLQKPRHEGLEERVLDTFTTMYEAFERDQPHIPAGNYAEVRYEDLVRDPIGQVGRIYQELNLGGFEAMRPALESFWSEQKDYQTNRFQISDAVRAKIADRWRPFIDKYGYAAS